MKTNIYDIEQFRDLLWKSYPCYIVYHNYRKSWNIIDIESFDNISMAAKYQYNIASLFNDLEISNLTYELFKLVWLLLYYEFIDYLESCIQPTRNSIKVGV